MLNIKPTHKLLKNYYAELKQFTKLGAQHDGAVRVAFLLCHAVCLKASGFLVCK